MNARLIKYALYIVAATPMILSAYNYSQPYSTQSNISFRGGEQGGGERRGGEGSQDQLNSQQQQSVEQNRRDENEGWNGNQNERQRNMNQNQRQRERNYTYSNNNLNNSNDVARGGEDRGGGMRSEGGFQGGQGHMNSQHEQSMYQNRRDENENHLQPTDVNGANGYRRGWNANQGLNNAEENNAAYPQVVQPFYVPSPSNNSNSNSNSGNSGSYNYNGTIGY